MKQKTLDELWKEFAKCGSGFELESDRDYKSRGEPLYYHLRMYGLCYIDKYEISGPNIKELLEQAIKDCKIPHQLLGKVYVQNS